MKQSWDSSASRLRRGRWISPDLPLARGFRTRGDTSLYVPKHPLASVKRFQADVVIAAGGGVWSSPANIAAACSTKALRLGGCPAVGQLSEAAANTSSAHCRSHSCAPFVRLAADAWLSFGTRASAEVQLGADPNRIVIAPLVARGTPAADSETRRCPHLSQANGPIDLLVISSSGGSSRERALMYCLRRSVSSTPGSSDLWATALSTTSSRKLLRSTPGSAFSATRTGRASEISIARRTCSSSRRSMRFGALL